MKGFPVVMLGALVLAGCTADFASNGDSPLLLLMTGINNGNVLFSDVNLGGAVCPDFVSLRLENHPKSPTLGQLDWRGDLVVERYEVSYFRSDGRGVQGVDVPYTISGNLATEVTFRNAASLVIEVVRRQAKLEPPLSNLVGAGNPPVLTMFADITLHGRTNVAAAVSATGRLQIDFSDFADAGAGTTCPTVAQ